MPEIETAPAEVPVELLDIIYDHFVRTRTLEGATEAMREWLGAAELHLLEPEGDDPTRDDPRVTRIALVDGDPPQHLGTIVALWPDYAPATASGRKRIEDLARHIGRALSYRQQLVKVRSAAAAYSTALDRLSIGAITIRPDGRPVDANRIARDILEQRDGLALVGGKVTAASVSEQKALRELIDRIERGMTLRGAMRITRPSGRASLAVVVLPRAPREGVIRHGLRIYLRDPEMNVVRSRAALAELYDLTRAEAEITLHLANGLDGAAVEKRLNIRHNTMRAHLRSIYAKVGVSCHADLLHVILTGAGGLAGESDAPSRPLAPLSPLSY